MPLVFPIHTKIKLEVNRLNNRQKEKSKQVSSPKLNELSRKSRQDSHMEAGSIGKSKNKDKPHSEAPPDNHMGIDRGQWAD
jgi:hypothetical protein